MSSITLKSNVLGWVWYTPSVPTPESKGRQTAMRFFLGGGQPRLHSMGKVELNTVEDDALQQDFEGFFNASGYSSRTVGSDFRGIWVGNLFHLKYPKGSILLTKYYMRYSSKSWLTISNFFIYN